METAPAAALAKPPPRPSPLLPPGLQQPGEEEEEQCGVFQEALGDLLVHLGCCTHSPDLPCFVLSALEPKLA